MAEMYEYEYAPLWDPKYAAVGVTAIVLAVVILDLLPTFIFSKLEKATDPKEKFPEPVAIYDKE